jgi:Amt family ammonium transporter
MNRNYLKLGAAALLLPSVAFGDDGLNGANTAWILTATALVLLMTLPGLSLFYGGLVRVKNILSVLMQCFAITCVASLLWLLVGYSLAFGEGNAFIGDFSNVLLGSVTEAGLSGDIPESVFVMFQMTFAIITPALIVGGFAERMRFSSMLVFSGIWLLAVYVPITHWVWGGGWLAQMGLLDFAGGTVVHVTAGVAAVVAAMVMGPRHGFPTQPMPPHNMTMTITGAGLLWVGWFGFNAGSALAANGNAGDAYLSGRGCAHVDGLRVGEVRSAQCFGCRHWDGSGPGYDHARLGFRWPRWSARDWYLSGFCLLQRDGISKATAKN